jgi:hypothetical protein
MAPVLGALCTRTAHKDGKKAGPPRWTLGVGYRYQSSFRHFVGSVEQKQREVLGTQIVNNYHLFDVSISRDIGTRWSINASLPVLVANRNQLYNPRGFYEVAGIGDGTIGARAWIWKNPEANANIAIGANLKLATGRASQSSAALDRNGRPIIATADQSIQTGDGRPGFSLDFSGYRGLWFGTNLYFSGVYLFNPADTNGVPTLRTRPSEAVMSVADQYLFRGGYSQSIRKVRGLAVTIGMRQEGVPARDLIGDSNGFRRPGYAVSVDPGFLYARSGYIFSCNIPFAVYRNRTRSVPDYADGRHGDAAFADYALTFSLLRRF